MLRTQIGTISFLLYSVMALTSRQRLATYLYAGVYGLLLSRRKQ